MGNIDILVHIPGRVNVSLPKIRQTGLDFALNLNLMGPLYSTKAVIDGMIANKGGSIVYVVSDAGPGGRGEQPGVLGGQGRGHRL